MSDASHSESAELVRRFSEGWSRRDLDSMLECAHSAMEFDWSDSLGPYPGIYRGHAGLRTFWAQTWEAFDEFSPEIREVFEFGPDRLVAEMSVHARGRGSGAEVAARGAMLWTVRDGKILTGKIYQTTEEALAAAAATPATRAPGSPRTA